ncbi:DoxX family protein [Streptomyces sp. NPDC096323]|uniref:DoxX family protein n=1 Tax=Streptomyces sp. NPDC096323 TaxID=3155822 RepID=UPI0033333C3A
MPSTFTRTVGTPNPADRPPARLSPRQTLRNRLTSHAHRYTRISPTVLRICVGLIFCWFGVLKFFPRASAAEDFAVRAMTELTLGLIPAQISLCLLAVLETTIGLAFITGFLPAPLRTDSLRVPRTRSPAPPVTRRPTGRRTAAALGPGTTPAKPLERHRPDV